MRNMLLYNRKELRRMLKFLKWIIIAPILLLIVYVVGAFSDSFRDAVITGMRNELNNLCDKIEANE